MLRLVSPWLLALTIAGSALLASPAHADDMDLALGRLRIVGGQSGCENARNALQSCPNNELFERLVSEVAMGLAPPVTSAADSIGPRGIRLGLSTTVTSIEADEIYWLLGTEGAEASATRQFNADPDQVLVVNRAELRKGLPLGFEVNASFGQGMNTSLWVMGTGLKWSLVEGFRSGLGQLPDVALSGSLLRSVGSSQATFEMATAELLLSKPFVVERSWSIVPLAGAQVLIIDVTSDVIDLTPGIDPTANREDEAPRPAGAPPLEDAFESCAPLPGFQPDASPPTNIACTDDMRDLDNDVVFDPVMQSRMRLVVGAQVRYDLLTISMALHFDLAAPTIDANDKDVPNVDSEHVARQVAFNLAVSATL